MALHLYVCGGQSFCKPVSRLLLCKEIFILVYFEIATCSCSHFQSTVICQLTIILFAVNATTTGGDMTQSCSQIPHAVSMPALTCNNCLQQRHESDRLRLENNNLRRDLKNLKHALENSQKSEKALRDRCVIQQDAYYICIHLQFQMRIIFMWAFVRPVNVNIRSIQPDPCITSVDLQIPVLLKIRCYGRLKHSSQSKHMKHKLV